jgi:hypothetical protein
VYFVGSVAGIPGTTWGSSLGKSFLISLASPAAMVEDRLPSCAFSPSTRHTTVAPFCRPISSIWLVWILSISHRLNSPWGMGKPEGSGRGVSSSTLPLGVALVAALWLRVWVRSCVNFFIAAISVAEMKPGGGVGVRSRAGPRGIRGRVTFGSGCWGGGGGVELGGGGCCSGGSSVSVCFPLFICRLLGRFTLGLWLLLAVGFAVWLLVSRVRASGGEWFVPVLRGGRDLPPRWLGEIFFLGGLGMGESSLSEELARGR